jgi:hypothetical protein
MPKRKLSAWQRKERIRLAFQSFGFCVLLISYWLLHVLVLGWFTYLFYPETYIIRAGDILADLERDDASKGPAHRLWWNKHNCAAARKAATSNAPDAIVRFTMRQHPVFLDNGLLSVRSPGYNARWWDAREKDYRW